MEGFFVHFGGFLVSVGGLLVQNGEFFKILFGTFWGVFFVRTRGTEKRKKMKCRQAAGWNLCRLHITQVDYPPPPPPRPPCKLPGYCATVSRGGGGRKCISKQSVVPSTNANKTNTCEATFALMPMCFIRHKCY